MQILSIFICILSLCISCNSLADKPDIKIGLSSRTDPESSGTYVWAAALRTKLEASGWKVRIFPNSTLGREIVRAEQIKLGLLEINVSGGQDMGFHSELYRASGLPFQLESDEALVKLLEGSDFLNEVNRHINPHGMRYIDVVFMGGMSGIFTARTPIHQLSDLKSVRMRAMTSEQIEFYTAWGAPSAQVAWEEVPQALQTGIADGYMNPPIVAVLFGHGGQLDYFTNLRFSPSLRTAVVSELWYQSLTPEEHSTFEDAIQYARSINFDWQVRTRATEFELLEGIGIEIIEISESERKLFRDRVKQLNATIVDPAALKAFHRYVRQSKANGGT